MKVNLDKVILNLYGAPFKRNGIHFTAIQSKYQPLFGMGWIEKLTPEEKELAMSDYNLDMRLGDLLVEALPGALTQQSSETEKVKVGRLQRRVVKCGEQDFLSEDIVLMKKGLFATFGSQFPALVDEICDDLEKAKGS